MTKTEKEQQLQAVKDQGTKVQARMGALMSQIQSAREEVAKLRAVLSYLEGQFAEINQQSAEE